MKKILAIVATLALATSCYDDYVKDYDWTSVYFFKQYNSRTVVVGEKMDIEVGVMLTGVLSNEINRNVSYRVNSELLAEDDVLDGFKSKAAAHVQAPFKSGAVTEVLEMPTDWYTISDESKFVIPKGDHLGTLKVEFDAEKLLNASLDTRLPHYALPLEITSAPSVDSINSEKYFSLIAIKYEAKLYGEYYHGGVTEVKDASGQVVETLKYATTIPQGEDLVWKLKTLTPSSLETSSISDASIDGKMTLTLEDDNKVTVGAADGSAVVVEADGESVYNNPKLLQDRKIFLKYKYAVGDKTYHAVDTLAFRSRMRDGINEWRDENPENYK